MTSDPRRIVTGAAAALESRDAASLVEHYAPVFVFEDIPSGLVITDHGALRTYFDRLFAGPQSRLVITMISVGDATGLLEWTWSGVNPRTGDAFEIRGASGFEFGPDGITRETLYYDPRPTH